MGASSFSVGHGVNTLKKVASVRMLQQLPDDQHIVSYPLRKKVSELLEIMCVCFVAITCIHSCPQGYYAILASALFYLSGSA